MDISLLKRDYEYRDRVTLFDVEPHIATHQHRCPYCFNKLYLMRDKPFWFCKSKKHANRFIISADKMR